ncbi:MAG: hypothetical protein AAB337_02010 [Patescibacteria group bacterium]
MYNHVTKNEFQEAMVKVEQRFDKVEQRFVKVEQRFDKVEQRLGLVEFGLHELGGKFDKLSSDVAEKFDHIIYLFDKDANKTGQLEAEVVSAHSRIDRVETHLGLLKPQQQ